MSDIYGVTFPIPKSLMSRFFDEGKTIFIKPATCYKLLKPGMKFVFYQSQEDTGFVGEGEIVDISVVADDPMLLADRYKDRLFLTQDEIKNYLGNQQNWKGYRSRKDIVRVKKWMAIELAKVKKYQNIQKPNHFVTVGGKYLRK
jgi:hypothetical protein